jgi:hypothetical protein
MLYKAALWYLRRGLSVFPVCSEKKIPLVRWKPYMDRLPNQEEIKRWWHQWPDANIGMACGKVSDAAVIDCDTPEAVKTIEDLLPDSLELPIAKTPSGGRHYHFSHTDGLKNYVGAFPGVDVRTYGGQVLLPPSSKKGRQYKWLDGLAIHQLRRPPMPERLLNAILKNVQSADNAKSNAGQKIAPHAYGAAALANQIALLAQATQPGRNDALNRAAYSLGQLVAGGELDAAQVETALSAVALSIGLSPAETKNTINSGLLSGKKNPRRRKEKENVDNRNPQKAKTKTYAPVRLIRPA